jgi:hypothetical protein
MCGEGAVEIFSQSLLRKADSSAGVGRRQPRESRFRKDLGVKDIRSQSSEI